MIMILGVFLICISCIILCIIAYENGANKRESEGRLNQIAKEIRNSANLELVLYSLFIVSIVSGFILFIDESNSPLLLAVFPTFESRIYGWFVIYFIIVVINIVRHARFGLVVDDETRMLLALQQYVDEYPTPQEGIDNVIDHITNNSDHYSEGTLDLLLKFLSNRDDEVGRISKKYLLRNQ
jgi:hypothetical protein